MPVHPLGLNSVSSDDRTAFQSYAIRSKFDLSPVHIPKEIRLTGTKGARTPLSQKIQRQIAFCCVCPAKSELVTNDRHILQAQLHRSTLVSRPEIACILLWSERSIGEAGSQQNGRSGTPRFTLKPRRGCQRAVAGSLIDSEADRA